MISLEDIRSFIIQASISEIIDYVSENSSDIKVMFSNLDSSPTNSKKCKELTTYLHSLKSTQKSKAEIQFLFSSLAFYFMKSKNPALVSTCKNNLTDSVLKHRLEAWHRYKTYTKKTSHVNLFHQYLEILSKAVSNEFEDYTEDVLLDLHNYYSDYIHITGFKSLFDDETLINKYPLLKEYIEKQDSFNYRTVEDTTILNIYSPSEFTEKLFNDKFIEYIKKHKKTNWHEVLLGYGSFTVRRDIIKFGQANFDDSYQDLKPEEIVKLYCYFNMRKHYYSSLHLFESNLWIKKLISEGNLKFIDIGCGPATCGIALVDHLLSHGESKNSFKYVGIDYYQSMLNAASEIMNNDQFDTSNGVYLKRIKLIDTKDSENINALIINTCYLFASPNLDSSELALEVNSLLENYKDVPRFLLFQNTIDSQKNEKYESFKKHLIPHKRQFKGITKVRYNNKRNSLWEPTTEYVSYEILKFK